MSQFKRVSCILAAGLLSSTASAQNDDFDSVVITPHHAAGNVHFLEGRGGNIGLSIGDDGVVMVDDQFAPLTARILAAIEGLSDRPIRFLINTHVHPDHTGGNENLGNLGIPIVAHDNVRVRMTQGIRGGEPAPVASRPVITYGDSVTMHLNGENIELIKAPPAHTDGDTYVFFRSSNVLHLGDVFRTGAFPVIDTANGGTAAGTIAALELAVELAGPDTVVLPGHGQVSTETDVQSFLDMVIDVEARVSRLIEQGMSLEQIVAADPTAAYAERELGSPDRFLTGLFESLTSN
jgi:glyoxylase-like metal-dependent hydrolase (beta-lactamase superfamily II)